MQKNEYPLSLPENCPFLRNPLTQAGLRVLKSLQDSGHEAWMVGGVARDLLLQGPGFEPQDIDIATSAQPHEIENIFEDVHHVGKHFGVCIVRTAGRMIEVATFREDGAYHDGRRPHSVAYSGLLEDVRRRDFTINALYIDPLKNKIFDACGGRQDIQEKILRCVGIPQERLSADLLRILRCARFAAAFDFHIDEQTWEAAKAQAHRLPLLARERIIAEFEKVPSAGVHTYLMHLHDLGCDTLLFQFDWKDALQGNWRISEKEWEVLRRSLGTVLATLYWIRPQRCTTDLKTHLQEWPLQVQDKRTIDAMWRFASALQSKTKLKRESWELLLYRLFKRFSQFPFVDLNSRESGRSLSAHFLTTLGELSPDPSVQSAVQSVLEIFCKNVQHPGQSPAECIHDLVRSFLPARAKKRFLHMARDREVPASLSQHLLDSCAIQLTSGRILTSQLDALLSPEHLAQLETVREFERNLERLTKARPLKKISKRETGKI